MLIKMLDGGIEDYTDNFYSYGGCPTCDYGSEYITEIDITFTRYKLHIETNNMYEYVISEGQMIRLFLTEYNTIQAMTEMEFIKWFKEKLLELAYDRENVIKRFDVKER
jgi:hypothetical protein